MSKTMIVLEDMDDGEISIKLEVSEDSPKSKANMLAMDLLSLVTENIEVKEFKEKYN